MSEFNLEIVIENKDWKAVYGKNKIKTNTNTLIFLGSANPEGIELRDLVVVCCKMRENRKEMCFLNVVTLHYAAIVAIRE